MVKQRNELYALICGIIINAISAVIGFAFFAMTKSMSILLDGLISAILCGSTIFSIFISSSVNKTDSKEYPLGRYAIENLFLLFRAIMMLGTIVFTILQGLYTIVMFLAYSTSSIGYETSNTHLIIYGVLMTLSCLAINVSYSLFNKKAHSEIIRIEIKASLYDGLVTIFAVSSLLLFSNIEFLKPVAPIGDSITVILLSIFYIFSPVKELINQINVLTDKRRNIDLEKRTMKGLKEKFKDWNIVDLYTSFSGNVYYIYITLYPSKEKSSEEIEEDFKKIRSLIRKKYPNAFIYLIFSTQMIHEL